MRGNVAEIIRTLLEAAARTVTPAPAMTEAILAATATFLAVLLTRLTLALRAVEIRLRLTTTAGDESRKAADILAAVVTVLAGLLHVWLTWLLMLLAWLLLIPRREGLLCVARNERLRLLLGHLRLRREAGFVLPRERLPVIVVVEAFVSGALRLLSALWLLVLLVVLIGILLPELFLRRGDQTEIMFGVLIVVFRRDRIARALCVASELEIFFRNGRGSAANFNVRPVGFVDPGQRVLAFAVLIVVVVVVVIVVTPAHALLTVSHDVPFRRPFASLRSGRWPPILDSTSPDEVHARTDLVTPGMGV